MTLWIWALFPAVMLETVQEASFWMLGLGCFSRLWKMGRAEESITTWNWGVEVNYAVQNTRLSKNKIIYGYWTARGRKINKITWVWESSPVTMLPTVRRAGVITEILGCWSNSTSLGTTSAKNVTRNKINYDKIMALFTKTGILAKSNIQINLIHLCCFIWCTRRGVHQT